MLKPPSTAPEHAAQPDPFGRRLIQVGLLGILAAALWKLSGIVILVFCSILFAVVLRMVAGDLARRLRLPPRVAMALAVFLLTAGLAAIIALFGWRIAGQYEQIVSRVMAGAARGTAFLRGSPWGLYVLQQAQGVKMADATGTLAPLVAAILSAAGRAVGYAAIVLVAALFLALEPDRYRLGLIRLAPPQHRPLVADFLDRSGGILRQWLVSRFLVMGVIGVLASIGLQILGIKAAIALGMTGALLTFIPYVGALMAAAPAVLVALADSPTLAVYTGVMFWFVHFIEGTFITPIVQDEQVELAPVLTIVSTLAFGMIFGVAGVFLASPIILVAIVAVQVFYLEATLGEPRVTVARTARVWRWPWRTTA